jgi:hypothetical protein
MEFTDMTHPSYTQVCKMICANENIIDRRVRRTWKENYVVGQQLSIMDYWGDINGWRSDYYQLGGHYVQLRKDVRRWNPDPIFDEEESTGYLLPDEAVNVTVDEDTGEEITEFLVHTGDIVTVHIDKRKTVKGEIISVAEDPSDIGQGAEGYEVTYHKMIYPGDKLEVRTRNNTWSDITGQIYDRAGLDNVPINAGPSNDTTHCFIDYPYGKLYIRTRLYQQKRNAVRISYRYGIDEPVPDAITRLACLLTAIQVINMQPFYIKVGAAGDLGNVRDFMIKNWTDEINSIYTSFQRSGSVHTMW